MRRDLCVVVCVCVYISHHSLWHHMNDKSIKSINYINGFQNELIFCELCNIMTTI